MSSSRRFFLPAPAASPGETRRQRWRRKRRTYVLRWFDRTILSLYRLISWLDRRAPIEKRYFRVAISPAPCAILTGCLPGATLLLP